jgi:hypothetical protein
MKRTAAFLLMIFTLPAAAIHAQGGGKAEPRRIGEVSVGIVLTGILRNSQEMEYVFAGAKGKIAAFRNPQPSLFDVRIYEPESGFDTEYDSSKTFEVELPESNDYLIYVRRKTGGPRSARFRISLRLR